MAISNSSFKASSGNDSRNANSGCLSGVLQRFRTARNRVPEDINDGQGGDRVHKQVQELQPKNVTSPSIVARLMGLDSMPALLPYNSASSFRRSRSVDSVDIWPGFLCSEMSHDAQIRKSLSFREDTTYLSKRNDNLLKLSFRDGGQQKSLAENGNKAIGRTVRDKEKTGVGPNLTKKNIRTVENKYRIEKQNHGRKNDASSQRKDIHQKSSLGAKQHNQEKPRKQDKLPSIMERSVSDKKKMEAQCSCQELSPVSVFDYLYEDSEYASNLTSPSSGKVLTCQRVECPVFISDCFLDAEVKDLQHKKIRSKRLSTNFENGNFSPCNLSLEAIFSDKEKVTCTGQKKSRAVRTVGSDCIQVWEKMCMLAAEDMKNTMSISSKNGTAEELSHIIAEVGLNILDLLLQDVVYDISR